MQNALRQGGYVFAGFCLSVCVLAKLLAVDRGSKSYGRIDKGLAKVCAFAVLSIVDDEETLYCVICIIFYYAQQCVGGR